MEYFKRNTIKFNTRIMNNNQVQIVWLRVTNIKSKEFVRLICSKTFNS